MERLADQLIGDMGAIEVAGVDVIDAARHRLAQHGERRVAILRRSEYAGSGELHRAIAQTVHAALAQGKTPAAVMSVMMRSPRWNSRNMEVLASRDNPV